MSSKRRTRTTEPTPPRTFDEQLWSVILALLVLGGCVAGVIVAFSSFDDPRPIYNARWQLGSLGVSLLLLMIVFASLGNRHWRRSLQLAAVLSCLLHVGLMALLYHQRLVAVVDQAELGPQDAELPDVTVPDYVFEQSDAEPEDYELPVEVTTPDPTDKETPIQHVETQLDEKKTESLPAPVPGTTVEIEPSTVEMPQLSEATPRRSEESSRLSRHEAEPDPLPHETIAAPTAPAREQPTEVEADTATTAVARYTADTDTARHVTEATAPQQAEPTVVPSRRAKQATRDHAEPTELSTATIASPARTEVATSEVPGTVADSPQAAPTTTEQPSSLEPSATVARRADQTPATARQSTAEPRAISPTADVATISAAPARTGNRPRVDASPGQTLSRTIDTASAPLGTGEVARIGAPVAQAGPRTGEAEPTPVDQTQSVRVARTITGLPAGGRASEQSGTVDVLPTQTARTRSTKLSRAPTLSKRTDAPTPGATSDGPPAPLASLAPARGLRKSNVANLEPSAIGAIEVPAMASAPAPSTGSQAARTENLQPANVGGPIRRAGNLPVQVAAPLATGGLGDIQTPQVGTLDRRASRDNAVVNTGRERFIARTFGGPLAVDGRAREPARAFAGRGERLSRPGQSGQLSERTEATIELGLDFLARHQAEDGSWSFEKFGAGRPGYENEDAQFVSNTAATGLALLAFLGAGYDHYDDQYQNVVRGGLQYLLRHQKRDGDLYVPLDAESNKSAHFYSHGIAAIAVCEAYGMTGDPKLRPRAQRAIDFIVASQESSLGGWRYSPRVSSDTSVSGWQLMALKSGELAGLDIPPATFERVRHWLDRATDGSTGQYVYNPDAPQNQPRQRRPTSTMTAVGLLMRLYTGWNRNDPRMSQGAQYLLTNLPAMGTPTNPQRDTYYWYYATQVMFHMKGDYWKAWSERLHPLLVERQIQTGPLAGSWDPLGAVPDRWGPAGGRIYVTTLNLLSLEVNYRHLPIYDSTAK